MALERSIAAVHSLADPSILAGAARFIAPLDESAAKNLNILAASSCSLSNLSDAIRVAWCAVDGGHRPSITRLVGEARALVTLAAGGDANSSDQVWSGNAAIFFVAAAEFADALDAGHRTQAVLQLNRFLAAARRSHSLGASPELFLDAALAAARASPVAERVNRLCDAAEVCATLEDADRLAQAVSAALQTRGERLPTPRMAVALAAAGELERAGVAVERLPLAQRPALALRVARAGWHAANRGRSKALEQGPAAGQQVERAAHDVSEAASLLPASQRLRAFIDVADALADVGDRAGHGEAVRLAVRAAYETDLVRQERWHSARELSLQADDVLHVAETALSVAVRGERGADEAHEILSRVLRLFQEQHAALIRAVPQSKKMNAMSWPELMPSICIGASIAVLLRNCDRLDDADEALSGALTLFSRMQNDFNRNNACAELWRRLMSNGVIASPLVGLIDLA